MIGLVPAETLVDYIGKEIGRDPETAKRWIQKLGLSDYAFNPKHLK